MNRKTLREAREQHDPALTQEDLEKVSGVHQTTISNIELGRIKNPGNNTVVKLETALRLERGTLRFDSDQQSRPPLKQRVS